MEERGVERKLRGEGRKAREGKDWGGDRRE